jgi:TonB family protein
MVKAGTAAYPNTLSLAHGDLVVHVDVTVLADGSVKSVRVTRSSGAADADAAALAEARSGRYRPATRNCAPVPGHFAFTATFVAPVTRSNDLPPG